MLEQTCIQCGKRFERFPSKAARGSYCSRECYFATRFPGTECRACGKRIPGSSTRYCSLACRDAGKRVEKVCSGCGVVFSVPRSNADRYRRCSVECGSPQRHGETKPCERCGKAMLKSLGLRHCSEECRRPPHLIACENCGKTVRRTPSRIARGSRYCSRSCYLTSQAETMIERIVRRALECLEVSFEEQVTLGRYTIDFLVGDLAIEADGSYWHSRRPEADARKSAAIIGSGLRLLRLPEEEIMDGRFEVALAAALARRERHGTASTPIGAQAARVGSASG